MMRKYNAAYTLFAIIGIGSSLLFTSCGVVETYNGSQFSKEDYREIDLQSLTSNTSLVGSEPKEIALKTFGLSKNSNSQKTINTVRDSKSNFVISIVQMELPDDSVKAIKYRIEFEPYNNSSSDPQWQMTWAGQQFICQPGRGEQDWTTSYCY